jgi:SAM-dependent methyltransferase
MSRRKETLAISDVDELLGTAERLDRKEIWFWMDELVGALNEKRLSLSNEDWKSYVRALRESPNFSRIWEDPFTASAAAKKRRGYPGDATVLDFIYGHPSVEPYLAAATDFGRSMYEYTAAGPASQAVRNRRDLLAAQIDRVCAHRPHARVLSVACGHMREAAMSEAVRKNRLDEIVGIDQDVESIALLERELKSYRVRPVAASVRTLLGNAASRYGTFNFIYASGLYDYLPDRVATRLTHSLLSLLRPGGKLWISNFAPDIRDRGYMEACMDWWLIFRDERQMQSLVEGLNVPDLSARTFREPEQNIVFLECLRRHLSVV